MSSPRSTKRVTRTEVAAAAGTSTAVVSYVINDGPRPVAAETRRRVLDAIERLGYEPDTIAQSLASGSTGTYGLIVPDISNVFFAALAHELEDATSAVQHVVLLGDAAEDEARELELIRTFARRRIDGLLFVGVDDEPELSPLTRNGVPVVVLDRVLQGQAVSSVAIDNLGASRHVTEHLIDHGHTDLGIIAGPSRLLNARDRLAGWGEALRARGIRPQPDWIVEAPFTRQGGLEAGRALLARARRPSAVFASNEQQAIGFLLALSEAGLRAPDDLAVASFDGTELGEYTVPQLSSIVQPLAQIARQAVELLQSAASEPTHLIAPFELRIRSSCGQHTH